MPIKFNCIPVIVAFFFFTIFLGLPCASVIRAQEKPVYYPATKEYVPANQNYDDFVRNIEKADQTGVQNTDSYLGAVVFNRVILGLTHMLVGNYASDDPQLQAKGGGFIGMASGMMGTIYGNPPASAVTYVADMAEKAHLIQPAYAQETNIQGYNRIRPLYQFWTAMRDLAYMLYIPIFIFIGITIMLRQTIKANVVASVQGALPKVILSLILVTFSFAIVGVLIDIMNLLMTLLIQYFITRGIIVNSAISGDNGLYTKNIFAFVSDNFSINNLAQVASGAIGNIIKEIIPIKGISTFLGGGAEVFAFLIFMGAVVYVLFRTLFTLIQAYISILIMTILAPLIIVFDAIPGRSGFSFWIRNIVANLAVFPAVLGLLLFASVLGRVGNIVGSSPKVDFVADSGISWVPPFVGAFAGNGVVSFGALLAFGTILIMPTALSQIQKFLKAGLGFGGILAPVRDAAAPFQGGLGAMTSAAWQATPPGRAVARERARTENLARLDRGEPEVVGPVNRGGR